jgi:hypothetical protein
MIDVMLTDLYNRFFTIEAELDALNRSILADHIGLREGLDPPSDKVEEEKITKAGLKAKIELLNQLISTRTDQLRG